MFYMLATTQRCCSGSGSGQPKEGGNIQTTRITMTTTGDDWKDVCAQWNCTMATANLPQWNDRVKGVEKIKKEWYQDIELPPLPGSDNNSNNETTTTTTTTGSALLAALEPFSRGTAQVRHPVIIDTTATTTNIPKIIWMFWDTGWPANPGSNMNRRSWELANPTFTVHALDGPTAERLTNRSLHVPDERWQILAVQARSDIYRTLLLQNFAIDRYKIRSI
jgi:hypothetical protein